MELVKDLHECSKESVTGHYQCHMSLEHILPTTHDTKHDESSGNTCLVWTCSENWISWLKFFIVLTAPPCIC